MYEEGPGLRANGLWRGLPQDFCLASERGQSENAGFAVMLFEVNCIVLAALLSDAAVTYVCVQLKKISEIVLVDQQCLLNYP